MLLLYMIWDAILRCGMPHRVTTRDAASCDDALCFLFSISVSTNGTTGMGRKRLYRVGFITIHERMAYERNKELLIVKYKAQRREHEQYVNFCQINSLDTEEGNSLLLYGSCMESAGKDPGSIVSAFRLIEQERRRLLTPGGISRRAALDLFEKKKAKKGSKHAQDESLTSLLAALASAPSEPQRTQLAMMLLGGVRNADIEGTGGMVFNRNPGATRIDVLVAKNRTSLSERGTLTLIDRMNIFERFPVGLRDALKGYRAQQNAGGKHIPVGNVLSWMKHQPSLRAYTTYSFRRNYIHRAIEVNRRPNGSVDWPAVLELTLHFSEKTVKGVYSRMASGYDADIW